MKKCSIKGCDKDAVYDVRLSLAVNENHEPALSSPLIQVCEQHKHRHTFKDFTPPDNWRKICLGFLQAHRAAPKREFSKLEFTPVDNTDFKLN